MRTHSTFSMAAAARRIRNAGTMTAFALAAIGCESLLKVSDPGTIQQETLANPALETLVTNGVIGEFQFAYGSYANWSGVLSDETFTDHTNVCVREFSLHNFIDLNDSNEAVYVALHRARQSADDAVERITGYIGATAASSSLNIARAYIYGAYAYTLLAEGFCESPVNLSNPVNSDSLFAMALSRFDKGITTATAANAGTNVTAATDLLNMARVGAARAALKKGDLVRARGYAVLVPAAYEKLVYYSANSVRENNPFNALTRSPGGSLSMAPGFRAMNDPRLPAPAASQNGLNANPIYPPRRPLMYQGYVAGTPAIPDITNGIKMATGLEAQYVVAEADGPVATTLTFVNARRAAGGQGATVAVGAALMTELRDQRSRDFYLTGQRLGDLRRYMKAGTDLFPAGKYPVTADLYGSNKCFIVPLSEKAGNPYYNP
jgi:hypothetical protein